MPTYYHCCSKWDGNDLQSMYNICNQDKNKALNKFLKKYENIRNIKKIGEHHIYYVHMFDDLTEATYVAKKRHQKVLIINDRNNDLNVENDIWEFDHPMVKEHIPANMISILDRK